jgi:hypothetical protein
VSGLSRDYFLFGLVYVFIVLTRVSLDFYAFAACALLWWVCLGFFAA